MTQPKIEISLFPKQKLALTTEANEVLFGGAAGPGKSFLMRAAAITWCASIPGLMVYLFRRNFPELASNHIDGPKGFRGLLAPWVNAGFAQIVKEEIRFWNGSKIKLCHCNEEKDVYNYQGPEIHVLLIDELTHFTEEMYRYLRSRVRAIGLEIPEEYKGMFPRILCSANPGNIGHLWVKNTFVDHSAPYVITKTPETEGGMRRQFIPAFLEDNPAMEKDDPTYEQRLHGLGNPEMVKAYRFGVWDIIAGAFFTEWSSLVHAIEAFDLPHHWTKFRSIDWGSAKPFHVGWWAVSDGTPVTVGNSEKCYPKDALIMYREWYGSEGRDKGLKMSAHEVARGILERDGLGEAIDYTVADYQMFAADGGPSIAERFAQQGVALVRADKRREAGWQAVRDRLIGDDKPMIYFMEHCRDSIRTLPAMIHDDSRFEDIRTDNVEDHPADSIRYACMSRPYTRVAPSVVEAPTLTLNHLYELDRASKRQTRI